MDSILAPTVTDYAMMDAFLKECAAAEPRFSRLTVGYSLFGREITAMKIGSGKKNVLFVGTHHGSEWMTAWILLRMLSEIVLSLRKSGRIGGLYLPRLFGERTIYFLPLLNPDGAELSIHGLSDDCVLHDRLLKMNGNDSDFTHWQANGRGVDLNHNYDAGFLAYKPMEKSLGITDGCRSRYSGPYPESEPESHALAGFVRTLRPAYLLTLHSQGEEVFCSPSARPYADAFCRLSGYTVSVAEGSAAYGGLSDWAGGLLGIPSLTIECGKGENPLPVSAFRKVYLGLRKALFAAMAL